MLICKSCKGKIKDGEDYAKDGNTIVCMDCLRDYILENYDTFDLANALCIDIWEYEEPEPEEKPEPQIPGQIDIFGNVTT